LATPPERALASAAAAFALALASPARAEAGPCDLRVVAEEGPAEQGARSATIRLSAAARPRFEPSSGKVLRPAQWGSSEWGARWVLAPEEPGHLALLAVFAGDRCGWVALPPTGTRARADGPSTGRGRVRPGEGQLHLVLLRDPAEPGKLQVAVFAVTADGAPWRGAFPTLSATAGTLGALEPAGAGAWRATWDVGAADEGGARITASLGGAASVRDLAAIPGPAVRLEVRTDRGRAEAGEALPIQVTVRVLDGAGRTVATDPPTLEDDFGAVGEPRETDPGTWQASLLLPAALERRERMQVRARLGTISGAAELELVGGSPAAIEGAVELAPMRGSGPMIGEVVAAAFDAYGNPVPVTGLVARAARGTLEGPREHPQGRLAFSYRQEIGGDQRGEDVVTLQLGDLVRELPVRAVVLPPGVTLAFRAGTAPRAGSFGLHGGAGISTWTERGGQFLGLALDFGAWSFAESGHLALGGSERGWRTGTRLGAATLSAAWRGRPTRRLLLAASVGGGAGWLQRRSDLEGQRLLTEGRWAGLATAATALGLQAWRGGPFIEARAAWAPRPGLDSLRGSFTAISFALGCWFDAG